ncbi:MAG: ATPase [Streptosporangiales bacterium]|nr:ATPase [Streptosporangiales bacterium]
MTIDGERATLSYERRLPYPIEAVWAALTEPEQRAAWFGATTIDGRAGGTIEMVAVGPPAPPERRRMTGRIVAWDPPYVLEHEWKQQDVGESVVRYELVADGDATILRFTHRGLRARDARGYAPGEHAFLDRLGAFLDGSELPNWGERYANVQPAYA